jgi:hypothetical protein
VSARGSLDGGDLFGSRLGEERVASAWVAMVCGACVQINSLSSWRVEARAIPKLVENVQIHRSRVETPFLVVYWPKGFTVAVNVALAGTDGGVSEG